MKDVSAELENVCHVIKTFQKLIRLQLVTAVRATVHIRSRHQRVDDFFDIHSVLIGNIL